MIIRNKMYQKIAYLCLIIWWGAFTFYSGVVISVGMEVLGSHRQMGMITQEVTNYLNPISLVIFVLLTHAFRKEKDTFSLGLALITLQISLFILHRKLSDSLGNEQFNREAFYSLHRIYLLISTAIWGIVSWIVAQKTIANQL